MDEILIEEKKYVSSKRAAQITGYAKDYIGQLCREGRVPARLVGRSWYVLESAIQDHRFGKPSEDVLVEKEPEKDVQDASFPRYEAVEPQILPSVNRLRETAPIHEIPKNDAPEAVLEAFESPEANAPWKSWFDMASAPTGGNVIGADSQESGAEAPIEESFSDKKEEAEEIDIPIRAIYHPQLSQAPDGYINEIRPAEPLGEHIEAHRHEDGEVRVPESFAYRMPVQIVTIAIGIVAVLVAALGSGYLDGFTEYIGPASIIAGVSSVKK